MAVRRRLTEKFIVVADSGVARILHVARPLADSPARGDQLEEVVRLDSPVARKATRELVSDRTGRVFDSASRAHVGPASHSRHGAASDFDPHTEETRRFAKRLARRLDVERRRQRIDELVLIAAPRFLGVLRPQLSGPTRELVTREVARDLTHAQDSRILRTAAAGG
jgi:protein required for attachment to host cells